MINRQSLLKISSKRDLSIHVATVLVFVVTNRAFTVCHRANVRANVQGLIGNLWAIDLIDAHPHGAAGKDNLWTRFCLGARRNNNGRIRYRS
jgi:hypothetical protein